MCCDCRFRPLPIRSCTACWVVVIMFTFHSLQSISCPPPLVCPPFHELVVRPVEGECCPEQMCSQRCPPPCTRKLCKSNANALCSTWVLFRSSVVCPHPLTLAPDHTSTYSTSKDEWVLHVLHTVYAAGKHRTLSIPLNEFWCEVVVVFTDCEYILSVCHPLRVLSIQVLQAKHHLL